MAAQLIIFIVGMNIVSKLYLIRKDKEQVMKRDYIKFFVVTVHHWQCLVDAVYVYDFYEINKEN